MHIRVCYAYMYLKYPYFIKLIHNYYCTLHIIQLIYNESIKTYNFHITLQFVTRSMKKIEGNTHDLQVVCEVTQVKLNLFWIGCDVTDRLRL